MKTNYLIYGATGTLGRWLCERLSGGGSEIFAVGRSAEKLEDLSRHFSCKAIIADALDDDFHEKVAEGLRGVDELSGAVNCIGSILLKPMHLTAPKEWRDTLRLNLDTSLSMAQVVSSKCSNHGTSLVFLSSGAAKIGLAYHEAIAAAKAGVEGLTRSLAASYASKGLRCNCVAPGLFESQMSKDIFEKDSARKTSEKFHPIGRLGTVEDVGEAVLWFLEEKQSWVTGQVLGVDGGLAGLKV